MPDASSDLVDGARQVEEQGRSGHGPEHDGRRERRAEQRVSDLDGHRVPLGLSPPPRHTGSLQARRPAGRNARPAGRKRRRTVSRESRVGPWRSVASDQSRTVTRSVLPLPLVVPTSSDLATTIDSAAYAASAAPAGVISRPADGDRA